MSFVAACIELGEVIHPDDAQINSQVDVTIPVSVDVDKDITAGDYANSHIIVAMLAPEKWNIAENATLTYSSSDIPGGPCDKAVLRLATDSDTDKDGNVLNGAYFMKKFGTVNNYEPVEWVVFISEKTHAWTPEQKCSGSVEISFTTGSENLKTNLVYVIGNSYDGLPDDSKFYSKYEKIFETKGGDNPTIDYTLPKVCSISQEAYTWEDIVCFNYDTSVKVNGEDSPLKDVDEVYFIGTATYGGNTVTVDETSEKNLMFKSGALRSIYMYPHEFFGIPAGNKIDKITFYISNKDKSVVVKNPDGSEFSLEEKNK